MKKIYKVRSVMRYDFKNRDTGDEVRGVKITCEGMVRQEDNFIGYKDFTISTKDVSLFTKFFGCVPGEFEMELEEIPTRKGLMLELVDVMPVKNGIKAV